MHPPRLRHWLRLLIPPLAIAAMAGCASTATQAAPPVPQVLRVGLLFPADDTWQRMVITRHGSTHQPLDGAAGID
ncbi:MAG TPA: hypothetical protein VIC85_06430 [Ktedonobacterales bacterium]|jgi:hypothetical protein